MHDLGVLGEGGQTQSDREDDELATGSGCSRGTLGVDRMWRRDPLASTTRTSGWGS